MSDRVYDQNPGVTAPSLTRKADGAILFGKLVMKGTASGDVKVVTGSGQAIYGYALPDEVLQNKNGADTYVDGNVVNVMSLTAGKIVLMYNNGGVTEADQLEASTEGDVATAAGHKHVENTAGSYTQNADTGLALIPKIIGIALEDASDNTWGKVLII